MRKIFCLNKISTVGLRVLPKEYVASTDSIDGADAVMVRSAPMLEMKLPESVLCVGRAGAGVNNIPLDDYAKAGVVVFNTPGANANAVKELTIAGMLLAARDLRGSMKWVQDNKGDESINKSMEKAKSAFAGTEILGKTLGIIGCGAIGALVAQAGAAMGMHVVGVEPSQATIERYKEIYPSGMKFVSYDELYACSDYVSIHVPLLDATRGMINTESIGKMKAGVVIINCARDALVNDDDMKEALASGKVYRYVTDFPNYKTANMEGVIAFSHLGASTEEAEDNCAAMASNEIVGFIENGQIINSVNFPRIDLGKAQGKRLVVLHEASLESGKIVEEVSSCRNVLQSASGVKGNYAATVIDFSCKEGPKTCLKEILHGLPGILRVRVIE